MLDDASKLREQHMGRRFAVPALYIFARQAGGHPENLRLQPLVSPERFHGYDLRCAGPVQ
jgi:hypothetical protein